MRAICIGGFGCRYAFILAVLVVVGIVVVLLLGAVCVGESFLSRYGVVVCKKIRIGVDCYWRQHKLLLLPLCNIHSCCCHCPVVSTAAAAD